MMATTLLETDDVVVTRFWGGEARGCMVETHFKATGESVELPCPEGLLPARVQLGNGWSMHVEETP
jgi:hypothetical protein